MNADKVGGNVSIPKVYDKGKYVAVKGIIPGEMTVVHENVVKAMVERRIRRNSNRNEQQTETDISRTRSRIHQIITA